MEDKKTLQDLCDDELVSRGFTLLGQFLETEISGQISMVQQEEGTPGSFETHGAYEGDENTPLPGQLRLYHKPHYSD